MIEIAPNDSKWMLHAHYVKGYMDGFLASHSPKLMVAMTCVVFITGILSVICLWVWTQRRSK